MAPRPPTSGYARIAQAEEEEEEEGLLDDDDPFNDPPTISQPARYEAIQPGRRERMGFMSGPSSPRRSRRRSASSAGVDIKALNARVERWAEEIKEKFKIRRVRGKSSDDETLEIYSSVFQAPDGLRPATRETLDSYYDDGSERMSKLEFDDIVESVRTAIDMDIQPNLISQGSSGSYFARNRSGKVVGVFKPKDEEPYASKNPKWTKWLHRNLLPFAFGRAMLIPNLSYVSEAAAYVLDCQLHTNIVPYTDVVSLGSKAFYYDYFERNACRRKRKPLPEKPGSFQVFLKGYKGATDFFRQHPWPDRQGNSLPSRPKYRRKGWTDSCRPSTAVEEDSEDEMSPEAQRQAVQEFWTEELQLSFREELEKLVILDYVMRNTDRGTDNWMIRIDKEQDQAALVMDTQKNDHVRPRTETMTTQKAKSTKIIPRLGAIDNSLSWPWKHPDAWRSYPFGWLFLPVSLIGQPFSEKTRKHFLPLLTSKVWWRDTQIKLRACFEIDQDFQEKMYARQMAVMKGQAWNVVETLKTADHGPLELTRRSRVLVWDDIVEIPVVVPLTRPSEDMRRTAATRNVRRPKDINEDEEMDISTAYASEPQAGRSQDLLGLNDPGRELGDNPFNVSRQSENAGGRGDSPPISLRQDHESPPAARRNGSKARHRASTSESETSKRQSPRRRLSFSLKHGLSFEPYNDEEDGDLGFAAANHQEGSRRKVIVERLEMVKSKKPVFTCC
ncbi:hypothetical protein K470DRAFT_217088 [Piedraia hortae CBS 480.64]|uniref:Phosphatidylinositol 4-kinase n=1 Tax=Piedraia hortae CBS 480.64 TaxID=1314780 RepID=A0A6A7BYQ6_9PEZI|nr:hypothetical protein K470DRAFT_217088 [Piedraia hortae CBS 480.64]